MNESEGTGFRIEQFWCFLSEQGVNDEGIPAITMPGHDGSGTTTTVPLVCSNLEIVEFMRPYAEAIAKRTGKPLVLARFDRRVDLERIQP